MVYGEVADSIQGRPEALSRRPRFTSDAEWSAYGERVTALARHTLARGVRLAYHHHMGAYVETAEDVDHLMRVTGPEVGLLHDTGHVTLRRRRCADGAEEARRARLSRPLQGRAPGRGADGAQSRLELPRFRPQWRLQHAGRRLRSISPR